MWVSKKHVLALMIATIAASTSADERKSDGVVAILPPAGGPAAQVLPTGTLHFPGREYRTGGGWWSLTCQGGCRLLPVRLRVTPRPHPVYDGAAVDGQFMTFHPQPTSAPVMFFKPPASLAKKLALRPGPITTWHHGVVSKLRPSIQSPGTMDSELELPDGRLLRFVPTLLTPRKPPPAGEAHYVPLVLDVVLGDKRQTLGEFYFGIEGAVEVKPAEYLRWVGDLDGDGRPDLIVSLAMDGFSNQLRLFLSSLAKRGEIVGEAGSFDHFPIDVAGC